MKTKLFFRKLLNFSMIFIGWAMYGQSSNDSIEIPLEKDIAQNPEYRSEIYPLIFMMVLIIVLLIFFLMMRQSGKNKRNNYRKSFKN